MNKPMESTFHDMPIQFDADAIINYASMGCLGLVIIGGVQLSTSIVIALMSVFAVSYILVSARETHYGAKAWNIMMNYRIATDIAFTLIFAWFFGTTIIGLASAGAGGIFISWFLNKQAKEVGTVEVPPKNAHIKESNHET